MSHNVLAVVAGDEITQEEFQSFLRGVPKEQRSYLGNPKFRDQCLEQLVAIHMFAKEGEEQKLDETEEFQAALADVKRDLLAQAAMRHALKDVKASEEECRAYYDANQKQFVKGSMVSARHILTKTEEKCQEALEAIVSGEKDFDAAAEAFSTCPSKSNGGDLGEFGKGQMVKEFEDAAFSAEIGHIVGPVKTQFGYHLIRVDAKTEETLAPYEEVKETICKTLTQKKQNAAYSVKVEEMKEKYLC